ncbi:hypothetical protein [Nitrosomonas sp. Nm51]|uniref:hypothetical protein n=1 Tax=Nitrosomonas sp. Nm51 TaxID=133720 RepID=UPI00115FCE6F|nr:hypothetical protein [Nitrosomonas sp. Nm51]
MKRLHETLSQTWRNIQSSLFPWLSEESGPLTKKQQELVTTLELVRIEEFIITYHGYPGRDGGIPVSGLLTSASTATVKQQCL